MRESDPLDAFQNSPQKSWQFPPEQIAQTDSELESIAMYDRLIKYK